MGTQSNSKSLQELRSLNRAPHRMARYLQKISLRPYTDTEMWAGWELEGLEGEVEGLILADSMTAEEIARLGVTEFQKIPRDYVDVTEFRPRN